jgi:membrane-associated phospholipid phosphatase
MLTAQHAAVDRFLVRSRSPNVHLLSMWPRTPSSAAVALALLVAVGAPPAHAQPSDTARISRAPLFTWRDAAIGAIALGASIALAQQDSRIANDLADDAVQGKGAYRQTADLANFINEKSLFIAGGVVYGVGRLADRPHAADIGFHVAEAVFVSSAVATVIRGGLGRSRPFVTQGDDAFDFHYGKGFGELAYRAFPSIHTSASFSTAAVLVEEVRHRWPQYTWFVAPPAYAIAVMPGLARMYRAKHWASDVLAGAVLGVMTGVKVVGYHHSHPGNRIDRYFLGVQAWSDGERTVVSVSRSF